MNLAKLEKGQWTCEQANAWYEQQPWIRGFGAYPSNCVNRTAMWQRYDHEKVSEQIDKEFALAKETGFNAARAVIQFEVWYYEHDSFMENFEEYLSLADKHGIKVMVCLGNDCTVARSRWKPVVFGEQNVDWGYHSGLKGGQHAGDFKEPGYQLIDEPEYEREYYRMIDEFAKKYGHDERVQIWDVWNEISNSNRGSMSLGFMEKFFEILRSNNVEQPLTADVWDYTCTGEPSNEAQRRALELSDIITFHYYGSYENMVKIIQKLKEYGRPIINNEWLNRIENNNVEDIFPLFYNERIGSYSWGLMQGYSQTYEPWGKYFIQQANGENIDLTKWQHDLYRFNGLPYIPKEIEIIRHYSSLADKAYEQRTENQKR